MDRLHLLILLDVSCFLLGMLATLMIKSAFLVLQTALTYWRERKQEERYSYLLDIANHCKAEEKAAREHERVTMAMLAWTVVELKRVPRRSFANGTELFDYEVMLDAAQTRLAESVYGIP